MPSLKKNFFYSVLLTLANYIFPLITYPYVSRVLGVTNIGVCNFVDSIVNWFILFSMMGISVVGVREIAASRGERQQQSRTFSALLALNAATTLLSAVALAVAIFAVPALYAHKELMCIGLLRLVANFLCIEWLFKGLEEFRFITLRSVAIRTLYVIAVFVFIRKPEDYNVYYLLLCLTIVANAFVNMGYSRRFVSLVRDRIPIRRMAGPFFLIGLYTVMTSMYTSFNVAFLGFVSSPEQVGYYTSATKIFGMIIALFTAFTSVMLPRMSAVLAEGRDEEFKQIVQKVLRVLFCLGIPVVLLMEVEAGDIIRIISGKGYEGAVVPLRIIAPLILIIGMEQVLVLQTMMPMKYDRPVLINSMIGALTGILLNILLVDRMEAIGSSVVWLVSELAVLGGAIVVVTRKAGIPFPVRPFLSELARYLILACLLLGTSFLPVPFYVRFIIAVFVTVVYFLVVNLLVFPSQEVKEVLMAAIPEPFRGKHLSRCSE